MTQTPQESREIRNIINAIVNAREASSVGEITPAQFEEMMVEAERQFATREREARLELVNNLIDEQENSQDWENEHPGYSTAMVTLDTLVKFRNDLTSQSSDREVL